jgi:DNA-binding MarR family transcriptional regulator
MTGMETTALRDRLMDGLDRFTSAMRAEVRQSVASRGLDPAQDAILRILLARPFGLRVRVLARDLGARHAVIALERKGLIRRQADPADARAAIAKVTPEANQLPPIPCLRPPLWRT